MAFILGLLAIALTGIDSLMQSRPDSALKSLYSCTDTSNVSVSNVSASDRHYYQLLLSEAFYKNDSAQQNRPELLEAMAYFDSIGDAFLSARCHHMNGVGYYEMDSVVPACAEYMKALEIMESHFEERDLMGYKAKFMALAYTHLCVLFSDQYLHEQAIYFGKCALCFYNRYDAEPWHIAWTLDKIGSHYLIMNQLDSADYFFENALATIPDTNTITYRDVAVARTMLSYHISKDPQSALMKLHGLLILSENNREYLSRCLTIGEVFYTELQYDSAWKYLTKVFNESLRINPQKQAAEWLINICKAQGRDDETLEYAGFLASFANQEENKSEVKSQLAELYKTYSQKRLERQHRDKIQQNMKHVTIAFIGLLLVMFIIVILYHRNKKKKQNLEVQIKEEKLAYEIKHKALSGRLKKSNETLREALKKIEEQKTKNELKESKDESHAIEKYEDFKQTPICREVFDKFEQLHSDKRKTLKTDMDVTCHKSFALSKAQLVLLSKTTEAYFPDLHTSLKTLYPSMNQKDWWFCLLYLLQLDKLTICVLLQEPYHTCRRYTLKIEQAFHCEQGLPNFLLEQILHF